jgi:hypothetical protein
MTVVHILLLAFAALVATAFQIPEGTPDGFYVAYYDASGHEVHQPVTPDMISQVIDHETVASNLVSRPYPVPTTSKRQTNFWETWCGCGIEVNHGDCDAAVADLKFQTRDRVRIEARMAYYSIRGSAVAFACNLTGQTAVISDEGVGLSTQHITSNCGSYIAGTALHHFDSTAEFPFTGYMRYSSGLDFCAASTSSTSNHC